MRAWLCGALALGFAACAAKIPPHGYRQGALYLDWDRSHLDRVNCPREDCERWFRTDVPEEGELHVDVQAVTSGGEAPRYTVQVFDDADVVARGSSLGQPAVRLDPEVAPRTYLVRVLADPSVDAFDFSVEVGFAPAPPPPPPPPAPPEPKFETHASQVLEVEGYGQETVAVLIESGSRAGMQVGYEGRLVDQGREIGRVVIDQVYPDGSRARIEGGLAAPVTHATIAEIRVPRGGRAATGGGAAPGDGEGSGGGLDFPWDDAPEERP